jgi:hypothetical protein
MPCMATRCSSDGPAPSRHWILSNAFVKAPAKSSRLPARGGRALSSAGSGPTAGTHCGRLRCCQPGRDDIPIHSGSLSTGSPQSQPPADGRRESHSSSIMKTTPISCCSSLAVTNRDPHESAEPCYRTYLSPKVLF